MCSFLNVLMVAFINLCSAILPQDTAGVSLWTQGVQFLAHQQGKGFGWMMVGGFGKHAL